MAISSTSGQGRPKGSVNKDTAHIKEAISAFVQKNSKKVDTLFTQLCDEDPGKALQIYFGAAEYVLPKLARTEATIEHSGEIRGVLVVPAKDSLATDSETS